MVAVFGIYLFFIADKVIKIVLETRKVAFCLLLQTHVFEYFSVENVNKRASIVVSHPAITPTI